MPTVSVEKDLLLAELGENYNTIEKFEDLCFEFGIELDDVKEEDGKEFLKIDIGANRYDLLSFEGLSRALRVFLEMEQTPVYKTVEPSADVAAKTKMVVRKETANMRPFVVCAILRNLKLDQTSYQSCLDLQDQLHRNLCRKRTLVAIGTHDLDAIEGPFTYEALRPEEIRFKHLFADEEQNAKEMLDWFRTDERGKHIKEYTDIIYDLPEYPVIYDANRTVLSLPPIINGSVSKISPDTKNMFIECTATDMTKAKIVLNTIVTTFSKYCQDPHCTEIVQVEYDEPVLPGGETTPINKMSCPDLSTRPATASVAEVNSTIGIQISAQDMIGLCDKMQLGPATLNDEETVLTVTVAPTRSDILHEVDIIEDIAIAYGFNNIPRTMPVSHHQGKELPINTVADLLRHEIARQGFQECLTLGLCAAKENFEYLNHENDGKSAVTLSNPKTEGFEIVRTTLVPGLVKTLQKNEGKLKLSDGIKLFEISDIVVRDPITPEQKDIGCRNERRLSALHAGTVSKFEALHGLVDRIMQTLSIVPALEYCKEAYEAKDVQTLIKNDAHIGEYRLVPLDDPMYFPGRGAMVEWKPKQGSSYKKLGSMGVLHPSVLDNFEIKSPTTVLEMNIEPFVRE